MYTLKTLNVVFVDLTAMLFCLISFSAMKASHPQVVTLYFAAESLREMNK